MFRKPGAKKSQAVRQRKKDSSEESGEEVVKESGIRRKRKNALIQTTKKEEKRARNASSDSDSSDASYHDEFAFKASGSAAPALPRDMGATATLDIDTEKGMDAQTRFERVQQQLEEAEKDEEEGKKLYRGMALYGAKKAKDTVGGNASSGFNRIGPVRAPQFLRQTVRWDFAPDICKDYKETGFCTFGDSCKFMHDRGDYKHGWELERDFENGAHNHDETNYEISDDEAKFPEECPICDGPLECPVVTRCKHYFCEKCALNAFKKSKKCRVCEQNTGGVFNVARELIAHLKGEGKRKVKEEDEEDEGAEQKDIKMEEELETSVTVKKEEEEEEEEEGEEMKTEEETEEREEEKGEEGGEEEDVEITNEVSGEESGGENESDDDDEEEEETEKEK